MIAPRVSAIATAFVLCLICVVSAKILENTRPKRTAEPAAARNCENVKPFFDIRNITLKPQLFGQICRGHCCDDVTEAILRKRGQDDFASLLRHNSRSLQGLLNSTATTLQNHMIELTRQSENKTLLLFGQVYRHMAALARSPTAALYADIRRYIQINSTQDTFATTSIDIKTSVNRFFTDLFPLAYHHSLMNTLTKDFSFEYKVCLKETFNEIQPFGDIPRQLSQSLSKSLDATRLLLQSFNIGIEVLNATDTLSIEENGKNNAACHDALLKMTYCPKCSGIVESAKPCSGYCLNVLRGCLTKYVAELDSPWNGYVEGIERLVSAMKQHNNEAGVNADAVIRGLDTRISEAIMYAMAKRQEIDNRVKRTCGPPKISDKEDPSMVETSTVTSVQNGKARLANVRVFAPPPETQLLHFLTSIAKTRGFYSNLADNLCQDESFAEPKDQHCWNGERIGEYQKTICVGLDMQKYNPEVPGIHLQNVDPRVANLADKLRHVHQMVMSSLGAVGLPESDNFMQGDSADGSGSGSDPDMEDNIDEDFMRGSGSGDGSDASNNDPISVHPGQDVGKSYDRTNKESTETASGLINNPSLLITLVLVAIPLIRHD